MTELLLFGPQKIAVAITGGGGGLRQDPLHAKMITTTTTPHYTLLGMYIYQRNTNNCPYV